MGGAGVSEREVKSHLRAIGRGLSGVRAIANAALAAGRAGGGETMSDGIQGRKAGSRRLRPLVVIAVSACSLALGACGDSDDGSGASEALGSLAASDTAVQEAVAAAIAAEYPAENVQGLDCDQPMEPGATISCTVIDPEDDIPDQGRLAISEDGASFTWSYSDSNTVLEGPIP